MLKVLAHAAVLIGLYLALSISLGLGLQVNPLYGNIGIVATAALATLYVSTSVSSGDNPGVPVCGRNIARFSATSFAPRSTMAGSCGC